MQAALLESIAPNQGKRNLFVVSFPSLVIYRSDSNAKRKESMYED